MHTSGPPARMGMPSITGSYSIRDVFAAALRGKDIDPAKSFVEHGGDSLGYLEVQIALADRLGEVPAGWEMMPLSALEKVPPMAPSIGRPQLRPITPGGSGLAASITALTSSIHSSSGGSRSNGSGSESPIPCLSNEINRLNAASLRR